MIRVIHFFIHQKLFINLLVFLIFLAGGYLLYNMNREAFPNVNFDMITVKTLYPGASPDEIEQLITIPIEKELREVNGLDKVRAYSIENVSVIVVYIDPDARNKKKIVDDVREAVENVSVLPANSEKPEVEEIVFDKTTTLDIALATERCKTKDESYRGLRKAAKNLEDYLYELDGVAEIERFGYRDREYLVEVNPGALDLYHIDLNKVTNKLKSRNLNLPGGVLRLKNKEFLLRTQGQFKSIQEVKNTVILANIGGFTTRLSRLARVSDTFKEARMLERLNGKNAIILRVWKKESADILILNSQLKKAIKSFKAEKGCKIQITYFNDYSRFVRDRLSSLIINGIIGFILLAAILVLLLGLRMSAIVGIAIPVAFMIAFTGMRITGITMNVISMFALVMVLGMIVDFSIVVAENSYRHMENGMEKFAAVKLGISEIFWPVTTTLLCISAAFVPLLFMTGIVGKFIWGIPMVIILCLCASWFASMFILPNHLTIFSKVNPENRKDTAEKQPGHFQKIQEKYRLFLRYILKYRYPTLGSLIVIFILVLLVAKIFLGFVFFPKKGGEGILIRTRLPQGTKLAVNLKAMSQLEEIVMKLPPAELESLHSRVGVEISNLVDPAPNEGTHRGTLILHLTPDGDRKRDADGILAQLRKETTMAKKKGLLNRHLELDFRIQAGGPPVGMPVNVEVRGKNYKVIKKICTEYKTYLNTLKGVHDISIDLETGKEEFRFTIDEKKAAEAGISVFNVAFAIRTAFDGAVATTINRDDDEIDIRVRFPDWARERIDSLSRLKVANTRGGLIPISMVTTYVRKPGYAMINRLNFRRVVQIQANINTEQTTSIEVNKKLEAKFANISQRYPGYNINYGGEEEGRRKSLSNLMILFLFALIGIYIILSTFFRSLILPAVVMSAIPFALVGVILALLAHLKPLSFMSILGVVSLAGIIVSNTLVLVQFINNLREDGLSLVDALVEGGAIRLRPVILTSATTVLGLFPTIYGIGGEDAFVAPLALAFGYGLIFASFITLVLIPCFYHIAEDCKGFISRLSGKIGIKMSHKLYNSPENQRD